MLGIVRKRDGRVYIEIAGEDGDRAGFRDGMEAMLFFEPPSTTDEDQLRRVVVQIIDENREVLDYLSDRE